MDCMYDPWPDSDQEGWYGPGSVVSGPMVPWSPPRPRCGIYPPWPGADGGHVLHPANISGYLLCVGMESQKVTDSCCACLFQVSEVSHQWILCVLTCQRSVMCSDQIWGMFCWGVESSVQLGAWCHPPPSSIQSLTSSWHRLFVFCQRCTCIQAAQRGGGVYGGWLHQF